MTKKVLTLALLVAIAPSIAWGQQKKPKSPGRAPKQTARVAPAPVPAKEPGVASKFTAALRVGYNAPSSELSGGILPDVEAGYRIGLGAIGLEPAIGFQLWSGDAEGTASSPQLASGSATYKQSLSAKVIEARGRLWYDLGEYGFPLLGIGLGAVNADTEHTSFGVKREEAGTSFTWMVQGGYAYPVEAAYGNVELLVGYRGANVDFETTGSANASGLQILFGWHAAF